MPTTNGRAAAFPDAGRARSLARALEESVADGLKDSALARYGELGEALGAVVCGNGKAAAVEPDSPESRYFKIEELLQNEELLRPPAGILPHLSWEGRVTLLAAPEKSGKSTLAGQGAAAMVTGQHFLGDLPAQGPVLWYALDEPAADVLQRCVRYGARTNITICDARPSDLEEVEMWLDRTGARLVVVDSLTELAAGLVEDLNRAADWTVPLGTLRRIVQLHRAGCILLHHAGKASGKYRDSSQIGAGVDVIVEMTVDPDDPARRRLASRGRVPVQRELRIRFFEPWYNVEAAAELPLELKVYRAIEAAPGIGRTKLRSAVGGNARSVDRATEELLRKGLITDQGTGQGHAYHPGSLFGPDRGQTGVQTGAAL